MPDVRPSHVCILVCPFGFRVGFVAFDVVGFSGRVFEVKLWVVSMAAEFSSAMRGAASPRHVGRQRSLRSSLLRRAEKSVRRKENRASDCSKERKAKADCKQEGTPGFEPGTC